MADITFILVIGAAALNGILAGASLDQSIKQLPARHRIGSVAYSAYAKAADLGNGLPWYIGLGVGVVVLTIGAAMAALARQTPMETAFPIYVAALLTILHTLATSRAAPNMLSQRRYEGDEAALTTLFNRFERWQTLRAFLQLLTFLVLLWALVVYKP